MVRKVLTVTINPAVDVTTEVEALEPKKKLRCAPPRYDPGGGGINVARMIANLGGDGCAFVVAGGSSGKMLRELCEEEGLETEWFEIPDRTRELLKVLACDTGEMYRFVLPGPAIEARDQDAILDRIGALAGDFEWVVASGSLAPNMPSDFHARLARRVRDAGARFVVDTSGAALKEAVGAGVHLIKPDMHEASELAGRDVAQAREHQEALLDALLDRGADIAIVTLGPEGAIAADRDGARLRLRPPHVQEKSPVGAGDAFLGAAVHALSQGESLEQAVRLAVAAAAATVETKGTQVTTRDAILELRERVRQD